MCLHRQSELREVVSDPRVIISDELAAASVIQMDREFDYHCTLPLCDRLICPEGRGCEVTSSKTGRWALQGIPSKPSVSKLLFVLEILQSLTKNTFWTTCARLDEGTHLSLFFQNASRLCSKSSSRQAFQPQCICATRVPSKN